MLVYGTANTIISSKKLFQSSKTTGPRWYQFRCCTKNHSIPPLFCVDYLFWGPNEYKSPLNARKSREIKNLGGLLCMPICFAKNIPWCIRRSFGIVSISRRSSWVIRISVVTVATACCCVIVSCAISRWRYTWSKLTMKLSHRPRGLPSNQKSYLRESSL